MGAKNSQVNGKTFWDDDLIHHTHVPVPAAVSGTGMNSAVLDLDPGLNTAQTEYAITITGGTFGSIPGAFWIQKNGTVGTSKADADAFQTDDLWGSTTITSLAPSTVYSLQAVGRWDSSYRQRPATEPPRSSPPRPNPASWPCWASGPWP